MPEKKRTCVTDKEKLRIIENSRNPGFVKKTNPSIVDYPSLVDNFAPTKKSTIEGFQCTSFIYCENRMNYTAFPRKIVQAM